MRYLIILLVFFLAVPVFAEMTLEEFKTKPEEQKYKYYKALFGIEHAVPDITLPETLIVTEKNGSVAVSYSGPIEIKIDYLEYELKLNPVTVAGYRPQRGIPWPAYLFAGFIFGYVGAQFF